MSEEVMKNNGVFETVNNTETVNNAETETNSETINNKEIVNKSEKQVGYKDVFTQKEYLKLVCANVINRFGDSIDSIAFTWLVYELTKSASWSALIFAFNMLPSIIVQPFSGAFVENCNKKHIMVLADVIRGIIVMSLTIILVTGNLKPYILIIFTLINSTVEAFRVPAGMAIVPQILEEKLYTFGTSFNNSLSKLVEIMGLGCAGIIIGLFGLKSAFLIDMVTFFASALLIFFIKDKEQIKEKVKYNIKSYLQILKEGIHYVFNQPIIRNICLLSIALNAILVPLNSFEAPLIKDVFNQESGLLSVLNITLLIGLGIGSALFPYIAKKLSTRSTVAIGGMTIGVAYLAMIITSIVTKNTILTYLIVSMSMFTVGVGLSVASAIISVQFMKITDKEYLARAGSILNSAGALAIPIVAGICSIIANKVSLANIFIALGIICIILCLFVYIRKIQFEQVEQK